MKKSVFIPCSHAMLTFLFGAVLPVLTAALLPLSAQEEALSQNSRNPLLQSYIEEGLQSNLGLKQKQLDYAADLAALKGARGLFFPDVSLNARYTMADGGRIIEFPVGDLLNPVYSTLNLITGTSSFPQIENEEFSFYRAREHETKMTLVQPVFSAELIHNYKIRKQGSEITRISLERYKKELVREITRAYYAYQKADQLLSLADTTEALVKENLRVSRSLFENDKVTRDAVFRSEAEVSKVEEEQARARNLLEVSRAYFNFLLNRSPDARIELILEEPQPVLISLDRAVETALNNREELNQIAAGRVLNKHLTSLYRGNNIPGLYGVVDYGFQGEEYRFTGEDDFVLASLVMRWNLFQGTVNRQKVQQSRIEADKLNEIYEETKAQIRLEVINGYYGLQAACESVESARNQLRSARKAYALIRRKYAEGQASLLELIDARTSLTGASTRSIIARSDYFSKLADFEYATGTISTAP